MVHRYSTSNQPVRPLWDMLLRYAISEDGALHAEKFYRTVTEEFARGEKARRAGADDEDLGMGPRVGLSGFLRHSGFPPKFL